MVDFLEQSTTEPRARASVLIGYVRWLRENDYFDWVAHRVGYPLRASMEEPPIRTAWVDARDVDRIMHALAEIATPSEVRRLGRETTSQTILPGLRPILEAALRRTDASPATIYRRLDVMLRLIVPDHSATYRALDERSGEVVLTFPYAPSDETLEVWTGALEVGLELCDRVGEVVLTARPSPERARFSIHWT